MPATLPSGPSPSLPATFFASRSFPAPFGCRDPGGVAGADRLPVLTIVRARMSIRGCAPEASALELGHHQVRAADAPAQLAPQIGEQGDGDGGMIAPEGLERLLGEDVAHHVLVGDDGGGPGLPI